MKIILSRKGLDSGFKGAKPSPILPCGKLLSIPIPVTPKQKAKGEDGIFYNDMRFNGQPIREIIDQLHNYKFDYEKAHLDPDLDRERYPRKESWRQVFGQTGNAQSHLHNQHVGVGDLFLFFGWFEHTTRNENGKLQYLRPKKDLHVIFGWLQVGNILYVNQDKIADWLQYHPHIVNKNKGKYRNNNTIYIAPDNLTLHGHNLSVSGAGTFPCFKDSLQLTALQECKSHWSLPEWLCKENIHGNWPCRDKQAPFDSGGRGQEFVFNMPDSPEAFEWYKTLFKNCS